MNTARSYNDNQLDTLARSVFYKALERAEDFFDATAAPDPDKIFAIAASLEAAGCGFKEDDDIADVPAGLRQASPYNDDLLNEKARAIYVMCMQQIQQYILGTITMNHERMHAFALLADACSCGFREDDDE